MDLSDLQDVDIGDVSSWPIWFRWVMIGSDGELLILFAWLQIY